MLDLLCDLAAAAPHGTPVDWRHVTGPRTTPPRCARFSTTIWSIAQAIEGTGDTVSDIFDPAGARPVPYHLTHTGKRNFIVHLYCAERMIPLRMRSGRLKGMSLYASTLAHASGKSS